MAAPVDRRRRPSSRTIQEMRTIYLTRIPQYLASGGDRCLCYRRPGIASRGPILSPSIRYDRVGAIGCREFRNGVTRGTVNPAVRTQRAAAWAAPSVAYVPPGRRWGGGSPLQATPTGGWGAP